jgi:hypothetical protein
VANPGDPIVATWCVPTGRPATDWVGLFKVGESDNHNYLARAYTNSAVTGKAVFAAPSEPGQ